MTQIPCVRFLGLWWRRAVVLALLLVLGACSASESSDESGVRADSTTNTPRVIPIYLDALAVGVFDWSWTETDTASTDRADQGSVSLFAELDAWEGLFLSMPDAIKVPENGRLEFSIYSATETDIALRTSSERIGDGKQTVFRVEAGRWQRQSIALDSLGVQSQLSGVWWQQYSSSDSGGVYLDNVRVSLAEVDSPPDADNTPLDGPFATAESTSRFLSRATFGATAEDIDALTGTSASDWFRAELNKPVSSYLSAVLDKLAEPGASDPSGEPTFQGRTTPNFVFWQRAVSAPDQLRQRMMFALSQIFVISNAQSSVLFDRPTSVGAYQDVLSRHALGNYRDLLEDVSYSPAMGEYLTYLQSRKGDTSTGRMPDENYARELMQLFSIGLVQLDESGRPRQENGQTIETYDNDDVAGLARVFTGMSYALEAFEPGFVPISSDALSRPMVFFPEHHESGEKQFLGTLIPAGTSGEASVAAALDALMAHPNTPPFISRQLIQRFVSSNPSPDYVRRVSRVFSAGRFTLPDGSTVGSGRRGDLAATLASILFDEEALAEPKVDTFAGKLREPVLRFTHWARAFKASPLTVSSLPSLWNTGNADALAQAPFRSPSVFNFYRPGYVAPGTETGAAGLTMPELQLVSDSSLPGYANFMQAFVFTEGELASNDSFIPDYSEEIALADDAVALVARLNRVLAAGQLRASTAERIASFLDTLPLSDEPNLNEQGRIQRVRYAVWMVLTTPEYSVQF